ncbi:MAG: right-handed parallel beta-helix repeat-containing protein [Sedimentisphaerales bacterium]|nr:right-handed parallel beta-helix repeat-containing protein [Sedimentisphaerales bacterium]
MSTESYGKPHTCLTILSTVILLICGLGPRAMGRTWHVCQKPLAGIAADNQMRTIGEAVSRLEAGDEVVIHGGIYRESVVIDRSGSADQPIQIHAAEGEPVVLTGADRITDWTQEAGGEQIYSASWPHRFVTWNDSYAHPDDEYHRLIGRCEQVFINGYALRQVLEREKLTRGTFYVDLDAQRLYVCSFDGQDIRGEKALVEASARERILSIKGNYVFVEGLHFRYAANRAQQGAVEFAGDRLLAADCVFEYTNASGAEFTGESIVVCRCTFASNGQLGFGANRAHKLWMRECVVRNNNTKGFDRGWEAGGNKICMTRGAVLASSTFVDNRGNGIWFDIGNEDCEVRNCLIARNENAGIFHEISYGLHAHDNGIVGNGFTFGSGAWGANAGISLSNSPDCVIERNLLLGNKEGFNFREQQRSTPRIDGGSEPVWNHHQVVRHNVLAFNRDAQVWGWFDVPDERHWPRSMQTVPDGEEPSLSLADLDLVFENNLYCPGPGQGLFNWGVTWKKHTRYPDLESVRRELRLGQGSEVIDFTVQNLAGLDLRVPATSPAVTKECYPRGEVPGVRLGTLP